MENLAFMIVLYMIVPEVLKVILLGMKRSNAMTC